MPFLGGLQSPRSTPFAAGFLTRILPFAEGGFGSKWSGAGLPPSASTAVEALPPRAFLHFSPRNRPRGRLPLASSSTATASPYFSVEKAIGIVSPNSEESGKSKKRGAAKDVKLAFAKGEPNATFADLPAPALEWEEMAKAPVARLDGAAIQIKNLLYVFAGYGTIDYVHSHVDVYNFTDNTWGGKFDMPKEMAHSHLGGPTSRSFVLDTETKKWDDLPPLPVPRFSHSEGMPATQLWRGRLHVMGGSKEDRHEPGTEHWSLAVKDGKALENEWRSEIQIPLGGPTGCSFDRYSNAHFCFRACVVANDKLLVIGGQEGDFMAKPGSPIFKCSRRNEVVYDNVYMLDDELKWKELTPMPKPDSHIEFAWVIVNNSIVIAGNYREAPAHQEDDSRWGVEWSVIGKMPYRVKTTLVGFWDGWLYFTSGQRDGDQTTLRQGMSWGLHGEPGCGWSDDASLASSPARPGNDLYYDL
ncbi:unnamed protein product [Spirodela intermedia]|uniref:Kelch repeat-containing protein n=1 Tax=Spirodela intermedia TaxID=51605 RepID=A0ABN7EC77_SPIIN|nr:unnamed protein product [Spirodela intermedia]